jgi:holo-[acyl-carrier protein] synthase
MIQGIGLDSIEVERVGAKIAKGQGFRELVFSEGEIAYCQSKAHPYEHYAARFAAKEAFFKALGTGWVNGTAFNEVEILPDAQGAPQLRLWGQTAQTLEHITLCKVWVSLTHVKALASAVVIIEQS